MLLTEGDSVTFYGRNAFSGLVGPTLDLAWYIDGTETAGTTHAADPTGFGTVTTVSRTPASS